ncbi:uncharacterized protein L201_003618 [Kwoniella dendrophila CBS 6074]|uniref:Uncharacterized protein n=1 Tax=Kwoniella dendrophila CBS 6074 TaxID=1295534 RepID=A0AAX4JTF6_9TREE
MRVWDIITLNLALLPQPLLDTADLPGKLIKKRKSLPNRANPATPDLDACQTSTQMRNISEEIIEADFMNHGAGRVTGKGWWTRADTGESGHRDLSLQIPVGAIQEFQRDATQLSMLTIVLSRGFRGAPRGGKGLTVEFDRNGYGHGGHVSSRPTSGTGPNGGQSVGGPMNAPQGKVGAHAKVSERENRLYVDDLAYDVT